MTPRRAEAASLVLPLALVIPLLWRDFSPGGLLPRIISPEGLAALALGGAAFALGVRYFRPGYSVEPNRWGLVVGLAAIGVYFLGSVRSDATLHWTAGGLIYLGGVIYIGGPYFAVVTLPAMAAALAVASGFAQDTVVEAPLVVLLTTYIAATFRLGPSVSRDWAVACAHCADHTGSASYCVSCGRSLSQSSVRLTRGKAGPLLLASLVILMLAFAQPVAFNVTQSGINYTTYSTAGIQVQPLVNALPPGWRVANTTTATSPAETSMSYELASARSSVSLLVTLSDTTYKSPSIVPANFSHASPAGSVVVDNQTLTQYGLTTNGSASFTGLVWSAPISYLSGGRVSTGVLSFLAAEPTTTYNANGGHDLAAISSSLLDRVGTPQFWSIPLATIGSYTLEYDTYIIPSVSLIVVLLFVGSLRARELRDNRVVDNSFGLSTQEFSLSRPSQGSQASRPARSSRPPPLPRESGTRATFA